jgi:hypothetical protein
MPIPHPLLRAAALVVAAVALALLPSPPRAPAQAAPATTLPLVVIDADGPIRDRPKVGGTMRIIHRGGGSPNRVSDPANVYNGRIRIEVRGKSSQRFPKQQFAVETVDARGDNLNVPLLGMPRENDWVLYAAYNDATLLRNVVAYRAARQMGGYAARTRIVELVLDGRYWGVYVLLETPKLDGDRVDSAVPGSDGYLLEVTQDSKLSPGERFFRTPRSRVPVVYADPDGDDLRPEQARALAARVGALDRAVAGRAFRHPTRGYRRHLDVPAAVDYALLNEFLRNYDAFRASTFLHEGTGGRLAMGPVWDFDLAMGFGSPDTSPRGCSLCNRLWVGRWYDDPAFVRAMVRRWAELRREGLVPRLIADLQRDAATLTPAQVRNLRRWRMLGATPVPAGASDAALRAAYRRETTRLVRWLRARDAWMQANLPRIGRL